MYTSYSDMERLLRSKQAFEGNSVTACWEKHGLKSNGYVNVYVVYSYSTPILEVYPDKVVFRAHFYSMTTRRIQGLIRRCVPDMEGFKTQYTVGKRGGKHYYSADGTKVNGVWKYAR